MSASAMLGLLVAILALGPNGASPGSDTGWNQGSLAHLIPIASQDRFLIKASFRDPLPKPPQLTVGRLRFLGKRSDTRGRFWQFDATGLSPGTEYSLRILDAAARPLCDAWTLRTLPAPDQEAASLRILAYTCAGGYDKPKFGEGKTFLLDMAARRRLLAKGLSFKPDVLLNNGDIIYWDQKTSQNKGEAIAKIWQAVFTEFGPIDFGKPMIGSDNEGALIRMADYQIAGLYGVSLRSTPSFFLGDDHDLFENDEGTAELVTLPPEKGQIEAARAVQYLYYPEFLPDPNRSAWLEGSSAPDRTQGLSESFGTLRWGKLLEALLYDAKRYVSLKGVQAGMVPPLVEKWLLERAAVEDTAWLFHVPSTPFGWSAGKLGEWYPDILLKDGTLGIDEPKPFWPSGWWVQHQRLVKGMHAQTRRRPVILEGDLHALGYGILRKSGSLDLSDNPIHLLLLGPLGTGDFGWPSAFRHVGAKPSSLVQLEEVFPPLEKNAFTIIDVTPEKIVVQLFAWRPPDPIEAIDTLQPAFTFELPARR